MCNRSGVSGGSLLSSLSRVKVAQYMDTAFKNKPRYSWEYHVLLFLHFNHVSFVLKCYFGHFYYSSFSYYLPSVIIYPKLFNSLNFYWDITYTWQSTPILSIKLSGFFPYFIMNTFKHKKNNMTWTPSHPPPSFGSWHVAAFASSCVSMSTHGSCLMLYKVSCRRQ